MKFSWIVLGVLLACLGHAASVRTKGGELYLNELHVLTIRSGDVEARAKALAQKLGALNSGDKIELKTDRRSARLVCNGRVLLSIGREEGEAQRQTPAALGATWAGNIRRALALPPLKVEQSRLDLPVTSHKSLSVLGSKVKWASVGSSNPAAATADLNDGTLRIKTGSTGRATITLKAGEAVAKLELRILPRAAELPQTTTVYVTGSPSTSEMVRGAVDSAIWSKVPARPGATFTYKNPPAQALPIEGSTSVKVQVRATAPDSYPAEGPVTVVIRNTPLAYKAETELWYCNDPENISRPGLLFAAHLRKEDPARLLYHHMNVSSRGLYVSVLAVNDSDEPARLMVIPGDSDPHRNPVLAGFRAADQFLRNWISNSGEIVTVPPRTAIPITLRRMAPQETMSGLCYLRMVEGPEAISVRTDARAFLPDDARLRAALATSTPWRLTGPRSPQELQLQAISLSDHIYPSPFKTVEVNYEIGGKYGFVRLGQKPIASADQLRKLEGNFGVNYTVQAAVTNPFTVPVEVEVVFEASAGYSGALFLINGDLIRTRLLQPKEEQQITAFRVPAGGKRNLNFVSVPLSGSSYPATITFRPVDATLSAARAEGGGRH